MSERKTAEIKFRVTPTFKSGVQAAAAVADVSMSEYIEQAVQEKTQEKAWAAQNKEIDGSTPVEVLCDTAEAARMYGSLKSEKKAEFPWMFDG